MTPQKLALIGSTSPLRAAIEKLLPRPDRLFIRRTSDTADCDITFLHHNPPFFNALDKIGFLKKAAPHKPIIILGRHATPFDIAEAFRLGANDYLFLPIEEEALLNCLFRHRLKMSLEKKKNWWQKYLSFFLPVKNYSLGISAEPIFNNKNNKEQFSKRPDLQVQLFGNFSVLYHGKEMQKLPGKKAKSLLAYLLYKYPKPIHRDLLMEKFWGDSTPNSARNCMNVTLHSIRKSFDILKPGEDIIIYENECYGFGKDLKIDRDIDFFESYWKKGQRIEQASGIQNATDTYHQAFAFYRGDFLDNLLYEEWVEPVREKYRETWLVILDRLSIHFYKKGKYQVSKNLCKKMIEKDPCLEEVHRRVMGCYAKMELPDMAIRQFHKCKQALKKGLDADPGKATLELFSDIRGV